jgi:transposase
MFIRTKTTPNSPRKSVQIVESVRASDGKVKQRIVRHVGIAMDDDEHARLIELATHIKTKIEVEQTPSLFSVETLVEMAQSARKKKDLSNAPLPVDLKLLREEQRSIIGIHDVYGEIYDLLGFSELFPLPKRNEGWSQLLKHIVMARIANPVSKRASVTMLENNFGVELDLDRVYKMMDKINDPMIQRIQDKAYANARQIFGDKINVLFYDCTTLYFESFIEDKLKQYGYSKDFKFNQSQVLLALLVTPHGLPVGYEVFPGASFEGHTLVPILKKMRERYQLEQVIFVADRGLFSEENLKFLEEEDFQYIVGARLKNTSKGLKEKILDGNNYQLSGNEKHGRFASFEQKDGRRLIVNYTAKRAEKDRRDREKSIEKLLSRLQKNKNPKDLISNFGYKKYLQVDGDAIASINEQKIEEAVRWDGLLGVVTNKTDMSAEEVLTHYHTLWQIEESFRINKHDLKMRPIFHWVPPRVKAHLAIAFIAFTCVRHLEYRVALQYQKMSPEAIRKELLNTQLNFLKHQKTKTRYCVPSKISQDAKKIYQVVGKKFSTVPFKLEMERGSQ